MSREREIEHKISAGEKIMQDLSENFAVARTQQIAITEAEDAIEGVRRAFAAGG